MKQIECSMNITKYIHEDMEQLITKAIGFVKISQFDKDPDINNCNVQNIMPNCGVGEKVFGIVNNKLILLIAIIDSSD